jgi:hypothetical protein
MPHRRLLAAAALLATLGAGLGCSDDPTEPVLENDFTATLNGANERPNPVTTTAGGTATVTIGNNSLTYNIQVTGITDANAAHIHIGNATVAGGILVHLTPATPPTGTFTGTFSSGTITAATLAGGPVSFESLATLIRNGDTYINVHTTANPGGEIRGQLVPQ